MMEELCNNCKARVFNPVKFATLWQASEQQEASELISGRLQFTMTASELLVGDVPWHSIVLGPENLTILYGQHNQY